MATSLGDLFGDYGLLPGGVFEVTDGIYSELRIGNWGDRVVISTIEVDFFIFIFNAQLSAVDIKVSIFPSFLSIPSCCHRAMLE